MDSDLFQNLFVNGDSEDFPDTTTYLPLTSYPSLSFDSLHPQFEFESMETSSDAPKALESLHATPIPPFLSKTYDLVDDPSLDFVISWGEIGLSFVVWKPIEFAKMILPRNFKHDNFSSFVRQLNTYGFRKIDTDKWEFANEGFVRGQKQLLKTIQRRKSIQLLPFGTTSGSSNEDGKAAEIEALKRERRLMMEEVVELQHEQRGTIQRMEAVNKKLEAAEKGQKRMVSFLAKMIESPAFLARLSQLMKQKDITSHKTKRKFVKHQPHELGEHLSSSKGDIVEYQSELCNLALPYKEDEPMFGVELMPCGVEDSTCRYEYARGESFTLETKDPILEQEIMIGPQLQPANEYFISSPKETIIPEVWIGGTESMVVEEETSVGVEAGGAGKFSSSSEPYRYPRNYNVPDLGVDNGPQEGWEIGSHIERWLDEDCSF